MAIPAPPFDQGEKAPPQSILELKLILAGRVLDNAMTLHEAKTPAGGELVTMHVVVSAKVRALVEALRASGEDELPARSNLSL